ncbi:hypothetical protein EDB85DRAFT_2298911 [Lactarius pseudohatsudake]|nr:hypothetical protein EDB85DRAFT_2298911 [Lactarius pseudohatsudake]
MLLQALLYLIQAAWDRVEGELVRPSEAWDSDGLVIAFTEASSHHLYASRHASTQLASLPLKHVYAAILIGQDLPLPRLYDFAATSIRYGCDTLNPTDLAMTTTSTLLRRFHQRRAPRPAPAPSRLDIAPTATSTPLRRRRQRPRRRRRQREDDHGGGGGDREDNHSSGEYEHGGDDDMRMIAAAAATAKTVKTVAAMQGRPRQRRRPREDDHGGDGDDMKTTMAAATTAKTIKMTVTTRRQSRRWQRYEDDHGSGGSMKTTTATTLITRR